MANTTVELRNLLQTNFELFDFDYTFDDTQMKEEIEQAIIDFYYFYEIGQETPDKFKHHFKRRFLSAISYYNELYNTTLLEYNPLTNYSMDEAIEQLTNRESTQDSTTNVENQGTTEANTNRTGDEDRQTDTNTKNSDYPQQPIAGGDYLAGEQETSTTDNVNNSENTDYTDTTQTTNNTIGNVEDKGKEDMTYEKKIEGITGLSYQDLIRKERDNILRIKAMIIDELKPCFMLTF